MSFLSKKESKRVSKLITNKLLEMGVKDEISLEKSGVVKYKPLYDANGSPVLETLEDGRRVPKLGPVEMPLAANILRRTVRNLRKQHPDIINSFLAMPANKGE